MPEYSSTTITPADGVQVPSMNGSTSGNFLLSALRDYILASKGQANGLASLGSDGKLTASQLPDLADDVIVVASYAVLPATGTAGKIYITADNNKMYRWDSDEADYVELSVDLSEYAKLTDLAAETAAREAADSDLNDAINQLDHRVQNLEQAKGDYIVSSYKDGSITPSGKGKWCVVEGVEGVSRVENNLVNPADSSTSTVNGITFTNNGDGSWTISGSTGSSPAQKQIVPYNMEANHSYLLAGAKGNVILAYIGQGTDRVDEGSGIVATITTDTYKALFIYVRANVTLSTPVTIKPISTDLNIYFSTSDLSFLGATDSAKLATIQTNYPHLLTPSEYGTRIVDSSYSGVRAEGVNLFDGELRNGYYNSSGIFVSDNTYLANANIIRVLPSTEYYFKISSFEVFYYDINGNFISKQGTYSNYAVTTPSNCCYINLHYAKSAEETNRQSQICLNSYTDKTIYHPYMTDTLSFPSTTLKSAGSVRDTLELNVEVGGVAKKRETTRVGSYTFTGNETWTYRNQGTNCDRYKCASLFDASNMGKGEDKVNILTSCGFVAGNAETSNNAFVIEVDTTSVYVTVPIGSNPSAYFTNGQKVLYELRYYPDPTYSDPIIDNTLLTESGGRMATVQTGTVVDGSFDMGFITL